MLFIGKVRKAECTGGVDGSFVQRNAKAECGKQWKRYIVRDGVNIPLFALLSPVFINLFSGIGINVEFADDFFVRNGDNVD